MLHHQSMCAISNRHSSPGSDDAHDSHNLSIPQNRKLKKTAQSPATMQLSEADFLERSTLLTFRRCRIESSSEVVSAKISSMFPKLERKSVLGKLSAGHHDDYQEQLDGSWSSSLETVVASPSSADYQSIGDGEFDSRWTLSTPRTKTIRAQEIELSFPIIEWCCDDTNVRKTSGGDSSVNDERLSDLTKILQSPVALDSHLHRSMAFSSQLSSLPRRLQG